MIRKISLLTALLLSSFFSNAQFFATDFTVEACSGTTYNLFDELDEEKVIVMAWTMPCFSCIAPCLTAHDAVNSFDASDPDRVEFYLVDDYADTDCGTLEAWAATNGITDVDAFFSNAGIDMNDYGTEGMPKVVVLGCSSHKIFYNANWSVSYDEIVASISEALASDGCFSTLPEEPAQQLELNLYPNPSSESITISYFLSSPSFVKMEIYNCAGAVIKSEQIDNAGAGNLSVEVNVNDLDEGVYIFKLSTNEKVETIKFTVTK